MNLSDIVKTHSDYISLSVYKGFVTIYPKWEMHPEWKNKIDDYDSTKSKMSNTRHLIEVVFSHKLKTINTVPVDIHFDIPVKDKLVNHFYSQVVLDDDNEIMESNVPVKKYGEWHIYSLGTGDGGWIQIEEYMPDKMFRCNHGWIRTVTNEDTMPSIFKI